ncbi:phage major capsid protein [Paludicola sp. MB14-C6]|uniref:phage major capsid protein n=1 Tax=Paludihabitans sp. MB14-C6 TaxID=3070656 RepID=UPI0027DC6D73|nr:phage major capsid protein [Paludicola sp. MB14-C6]WMJ23462.1 phage major capsid protein [Paludicola sp. MB14-C6]
MKTWFLNKIKGLKDQKTQLIAKAQSSEDLTEVKSINSQLESINTEIEDLEKQLATLDGQPGSSKGFNPMGTYFMDNGNQKAATEDEENLPYRKAFMEYVLKGTPIPADVQKASATTMTSDIGSVIPNTIMNQIIQKLKNSGKIYQMMRKTNIKGGVSYPTSSILPVATWVSEGKVADKQKKTTGSITFQYYKLQCRVAVSLEASTTSLPIFEAQLAEDIAQAMIIAKEKASINGTGVGEPKGIFKETEAKTVEIAAADLNSYKKFAAIRAKMGTNYRGGAVWLLTQSDWDTYIVGMVDEQGQPVARVTVGLDGVPVERLIGIPACLVDDDYITPFADAVAGSFFGALVNYGYYAYNSNLNMGIRRYFDEDTDEWVNKATELGDGKLLDDNALVLLKKQ